MQKFVLSVMYGQRPRSAYASVQFDQGHHYRLTESLDTTELINGEQRPGLYIMYV